MHTLTNLTTTKHFWDRLTDPYTAKPSPGHVSASNINNLEIRRPAAKRVHVDEISLDTMPSESL